MTTAAGSLDSTHPYTLRGIMQMLGLSRHAVQGLVDMGFVRPERASGPGRPWRFSFRDVVLLRTAQELRAARIPTRQLLRALRRLHKALPREVPAGALRIQAVGDRVAVRWGGAQWDAESGQLLMDFSAPAAPVPASVHPLDGRARRRPAAAAPTPTPTPDAQGAQDAQDADALYERAELAEETDPAEAERLYWRVVRLAPRYAQAYANLAFLLCEAGRFAEALAVCAQGVACCPASALLQYNRAVALEALGRGGDAIAAYQASLALDAALADAHQNLALLYERRGDKQRAIRHFNAYRRLAPRA